MTIIIDVSGLRAIPIESYATEADLQYALDLIDELKERLESRRDQR
jgi:hypothetical protein